MQREVLEDATVASLVRISQSGSCDRASKAREVQLRGVTAQARSDLTQARTRCELREHHAQELIPMREAQRRIWTCVLRNALLENLARQMRGQLREYQLTLEHR